ncbi:MAG TPA: DUF2262 domain-containing protein [Mucilaginibacter sp.]|nr:DUF2262 domain-containing protein [Mucilaginibacter sp.]
MLTNNKDFEAFASEYQNQEKEILVLTSDESGGAVKFHDSWAASQYFLAFIDFETNELKKGDGRINWLLSDKQSKKNGITFPYHFKKGTIYKLKVRELIDKTVPDGRIPSYYNRFMVIDVLDQDLQNDILLAILAEYKTPVVIADEKLGEYKLNKDYGTFEGELQWLDHEISVSLQVDIENEESWTETMGILRTLFEQQKQRDLEFRTYAGEQLTGLANDWLENENELITKGDFIRRISLSGLTITYDGNFTAYYNDDDMFYGHIIDVSGNIKTGIDSAHIAG